MDLEMDTVRGFGSGSESWSGSGKAVRSTTHWYSRTRSVVEWRPLMLVPRSMQLSCSSAAVQLA